jgi:NlpC/P60 family putative phage cell wall peptidase
MESWLGTPWVHGQALKGVGTDCVRFIISVAKAADWIPQDYKPPVYNQDWALHNEVSILELEIQKFAYKVSPPFAVGDILLFVYGKCASHAGIYVGEGEMIHAYNRRGVVRSSLRHYTEKFHSAWRAGHV